MAINTLNVVKASIAKTMSACQEATGKGRLRRGMLGVDREIMAAEEMIAQWVLS